MLKPSPLFLRRYNQGSSLRVCRQPAKGWQIGCKFNSLDASLFVFKKAHKISSPSGCENGLEGCAPFQKPKARTDLSSISQGVAALVSSSKTKAEYCNPSLGNGTMASVAILKSLLFLYHGFHEHSPFSKPER